MPTVTEIIDGRNALIEAGGRGNEGIQRRYVRKFRVILDNWTDGGLRAASAPGIPRVGEIYRDAGGSVDTGARCHAVEPESTSEGRQWLVTCSYSSSDSDIGDIDKETAGKADPNDPNNNSSDPGSGGGGSGQEGGPLSKPAEITYSTQRVTKIAQFAEADLNGAVNASLSRRRLTLRPASRLTRPWRSTTFGPSSPSRATSNRSRTRHRQPTSIASTTANGLGTAWGQ